MQSIPGIGAFAYDDNGNQTSGANRTLTWTSFDMPKKITEGSVSSEFVYGPEHQRTKQLKQDGSTVYYAGSQEAENKAGIWTIKTYWPSDLGVEIDVVNGSTTTTTLNWIHTDRLGSVIGITDQAGALKEKLAYDAWGKRRSLDGATTLDTLDGVVDNKGFTGHEMLDGLDLVHMNGRVYDPLVARFISADPIIQAPYYSQSYNRCSYVWNNPTNLTDPSGYRADQLVEQVPERIEIAGQRLAEQRIEVVGQCLRLCQVKRGLRELARVKGTMAAGEVAGGTLAARWAAAGPAVRMGAPVLVAAAPPALGAAAACVRSIVCGVAVAVGAYFTYEILTKDDAEADAESLNSGGVEGANSEVPSNVGPGPYAGTLYRLAQAPGRLKSSRIKLMK
ncbi:RHS repeat domain-containing protein [Chitinimonas koreensis]|uniref:RHS repeat domain-containing protein n=1 Tax=Chitinimonas koreensis TaxID=356302 RepID=UPI00165430AF|nr:RHS repeat-associated core domain-containing protein [Chitinimonas koreensis]QNM98708.1 RHS repeat-associated core domain-containing protein [Chitinimonas koreensis]